MSTHVFDCIVVGSGHAGSCAALAAIDAGCKGVLIVEKGPEDWVGGNGYFTAGAHRTVHGGVQDLLQVVRGITPEVAATIDLDPYTAEDFTNDIVRLADGRSDLALVKTVVDGSRSAITWLAERVGVPFTFSFNRQAYLVNGRQKFWGGLVLGVVDGGKGLIAAHQHALKEAGVETWFDSPAVELITEGGKVVGLVIERTGERITLGAPAVVLACGGFESSIALREKHMSKDWKHAKVRGTPYNTGDAFTLTRPVNAALAGDFSPSGCHSTCWDANAREDCGDRVLSNQYTKSGYPLGIMVNAHGHRFVDEGEDLRNYTYAKFGRAILHQPGGYAFQVWDSRVTAWLRTEEYGDGVVEKIWAQSVEDLAESLGAKGLHDKVAFVRTVESYNTAVYAARAESPKTWDPAIKDGLSTVSTQPDLNIEPPKSNWALPLEKPPFLAVKVACGITFTFGGLAIDPETASVLDGKGDRIHGLFATGEVVGGLFYGNYPGGSGLPAGAVFGRKAGAEAARLVPPCTEGM